VSKLENKTLSVDFKQENASRKIVKWLSLQSALTCFLGVVIGGVLELKELAIFFGIYLVVYSSSLFLSYLKNLIFSIYILFVGINSGIYFLAQLLGRDSPVASMYFVMVALPFVTVKLNRKGQVLLGFVMPMVLYILLVFGENGKPLENLIAIKEWIELPLMITLFMAIWGVMYLFDRNRSEKNMILNLLVNEQVLTAKLGEAKSLAEEASSAKSRFLATLSHELRTPMNSVLGASEMLHGSLQPNESLEQREWITLINQGANATVSQMDQILDFVDLEAGAARLIEKECFVSEIFEELKSELAPMCVQNQVNMDWKSKGDWPTHVMTDAYRLRKMCFPILDNAIKFSNGNVEVEINVSNLNTADYEFEILVKDDGDGIAAKVKEHIFESFQTADQSYTRKIGGLGIGLTNAKYSLELFGGDLNIESEVAGETRGTRVKIHFILKGEVKENKLEITASVIEHILIVDDVAANRKILQKMLSKLQYESSTANDGQLAIDAYRKFYDEGGCGYDLVLMDLQMPNVDGFDAVRSIRKIEAEMKIKPAVIYVVSANTSQEDKDKAREVGADDFYAKPIRKKDLEQILGIMKG
jgi:signal transduction histidine kinase/ActR/RegA family two-component response regulator